MKTFVVIFITLFSSAQALAIIPFGFIPILSNGTVAADPCNGTPVIGTTCNGGAIYAGSYGSAKYMVMQSGCDGSTSNPFCSGIDTFTITWRGTSTINTDIPGVENVANTSTASSTSYRGDVNTAAIVAHASIGPGSAAAYCNDMDHAGYADWYLASKSEMAYVMCHSVLGGAGTLGTSAPQEGVGCGSHGGKTSHLTGFDTSGSYWTSSETTTGSSAYTQSFNLGNQGTGAKLNLNFIRCIRRY